MACPGRACPGMLQLQHVLAPLADRLAQLASHSSDMVYTSCRSQALPSLDTSFGIHNMM